MAVDFDGVFRKGYLILDWGRWLTPRGAFQRQALDSMEDLVESYRSGAVTYAHLADDLPRIFAGGLSGVLEAEHDILAAEYVKTDSFLSALTALGGALVTEFSRTAVSVVVVSGGSGPVLRHYADAVGFTNAFGVEVGVERGVCNGHVLDNPATRVRKQEIVSSLKLTGELVLAVGDSLSDEPLLDEADMGIAVGPALAGRFGSSGRILYINSPEEVPSVELREFVRRAVTK